MAYDLLNSISLNNGVFDGDASTARILTQLQLKEPALNKTLPSPAEGLASIMMCTVLDLTPNFPFEVSKVGSNACPLSTKLHILIYRIEV